MNKNERIAVIGAGPSGITAAKNVIEAGYGDGLTLFEMSDQVGGNWVFRDEPSHSSVYETTHIISSKYWSAYEDFPFPEGTPDYPSHRHLLKYFQDYAEHFGVLERTEFNTRVDSAVRRDDGLWELTVTGPKGSRTEVFDHLMVSNGHHWNPRMPELPGEFAGEVMHSHQFKKAAPFAGKRVLVVGGGNSAADVAVECSRVAENVCISMRRGYWFLPKFMMGKPGDVVYHKTEWMPSWLRQKLLTLSVRLVQGKNADYGLEEPEYSILQGHPTLNSELMYFIGHGELQPRRGIQAIDGHTVTFTDGRQDDFDVIICATGYRTTFPFFDKSFIDWEEATQIPLYRKMFHADYDNLFFIGLFQPLGCIWPLSDYQAKLAMKAITGEWQRPDNLADKIAEELSSPHYDFVAHTKHAVEVDYTRFRRELLDELKTAGSGPYVSQVDRSGAAAEPETPKYSHRKAA
ncbi:flavin-containing monooxygenase [Abyssibacter profundi]|uniref:Monooxygenase n=1 Tax=Abyssibacter profundi TaxID=2182787 RepID=A0A363UPL7_9GAMM|nr:NAD(P)-binding domain-containing protein [Abyssibacter profundi]PWN57347.1 monooxygenase [Abyssibacter profundi]